MEKLIMVQSLNRNLLAEDKAVIAPFCCKPDVSFVEGKGSYLFDADGKKYLDFVSGIAVNALGHQHPAVVKAMQDQIGKFVHLSNLYPNYPQIDFAKKLLSVTHFGKVFFCNSGTEANEGAIKLARKYFDRKGDERTQIVAFNGSFHGRTLASLAATGQPALWHGFGELPRGFLHVDWNDVEGLKKVVNAKTCAIMLESLAGEGGVMRLSPEMAETVNALHKEFGCLVIVDEIQAGMGRLGTFLGEERTGLKADLVTLAKAIGAGLPLGAILMTQEIADNLKPGDHGTTFGGNPVACAAGLVVTNVVSDPKFLAEVQTRSEELQAGLKSLIQKYSFLGEIRGDGLLLGVTTTKPVSDLVVLARKEGLLIHRAGTNVIRLLPPLNVTSAEIVEALEKLDRTFSKVPA